MLTVRTEGGSRTAQKGFSKPGASYCTSLLRHAQVISHIVRFALAGFLHFSEPNRDFG